MSELEDFRREHVEETVGPRLADLLERIVRATAPTYPPVEYSDAGVWNREALEDALHDWVTARLLARGDLSRMLAAATTISRLRNMLTTSFGQFLTNRRQRTSATNMFQRTVKILKEDGRFASVRASRSSAHQLWTLSETPADDIGNDEVQERLIKAASSKSDDDLGVIHYGPYSLKSSPILRNRALADFLAFLLGQAGCALSAVDLFRVLSKRFNLTEPARLELDPDTPDMASAVASKVETAVLAESVLARIGKERADLVRAVHDADGDLARAAASAGVSRSELAEALDYVMALIADYAGTSDDAIAVYRRLTESLFLNGEEL